MENYNFLVPDFSQLAWDETARVWNAETGDCLQTLKDVDRINFGDFSGDGSRALTGVWNGVTVWNSETGQSLLKLGNVILFHDARLSLDGRKVVASSYDNSARIWNAETGICLQVPLGHIDAVLTGIFSRAGDQVLTAGADRSARIWNTIHAYTYNFSRIRPHQGGYFF